MLHFHISTFSTLPPPTHPQTKVANFKETKKRPYFSAKRDNNRDQIALFQPKKDFVHKMIYIHIFKPVSYLLYTRILLADLSPCFRAYGPSGGLRPVKGLNLKMPIDPSYDL